MRTLNQYLESARADGERNDQLARIVIELTTTAIDVHNAISDSAQADNLSDAVGKSNQDGDAQKGLDVLADELFLKAAKKADLAYYASEERSDPVAINITSELAIAIDPLDGSSNIETNVSIGTIFSILPAGKDGAETFLQPGNRQLASGFFIYGPRLILVLTLGNGTSSFMFCNRREEFVELCDALSVPIQTAEFAVNASNYRHWDEAIQLYIDDCLQGPAGSRNKNFNMRWVASLVADAYRIFVRGGVFLYPRDAREGYAAGRLRLVYEANPMALLFEQAGGSATDGVRPLLEIVPTSLHQRTPLVFGSTDEVKLIGRYHTEPSAIGARHPLFSDRGLFRA